MTAAGLHAVVAAVGPWGHLFPALALARALAARGARVTMLALERWRDTLAAQGLDLVPVPEYSYLGFPPDPDGTLPAPERVAEHLAAELEGLCPEIVVSDVFSIAPALAAELCGSSRATLIPYHYPVAASGMPFFAGLPVQPVGFVPPRTPFGGMLWRSLRPLHARWQRRERAQRDRVRAALGLGPGPPAPVGVGEPALVASLPQLEYPRRWPERVHVTGPMVFDPPHAAIELPPGDDPLVLVAPTTMRDPGLRLIGVALAALGGEPVRVLASMNERGRAYGGPVPANARVVDWAPYGQVLERAALVIAHGGHGTIARSLAAGVPVLACPAWGDQADNGARLAWSGAGLMVPRALTRPQAVRAAVRKLLGEPRFGARAREIAAWVRDNDGAARGAELVERYAGSPAAAVAGGRAAR